MDISMLREHFSCSRQIGTGDDFCMFDIRPIENVRTIDHPCRINAVMMLYCIKGKVSLSINLNEYEIQENNLILCTPGNIVKVTDIPDGDIRSHHYVLLAMSQDFASQLRVDFKSMINERIPFLDTPVITLADNIRTLLMDYFALIAKVLKSDLTLSETALRNLITSMMCIAVGEWSDKVNSMSLDVRKNTSRNRIVFEQFIRLVTEHYTSYRNVGFYADKLCLTPKYLSKLIKSYSGKSAPDWIDSYVILEAKNLLKYSDMSIKEIVFRLNFPNQSVFYKFFKARTGMTPSIYRNS